MSHIITFTGLGAQTSKQCCRRQSVCASHKVTQIVAQTQLCADINKTQPLQRYEISLQSPREKQHRLYRAVVKIGLVKFTSSSRLEMKA